MAEPNGTVNLDINQVLAAMTAIVTAQQKQIELLTTRTGSGRSGGAVGGGRREPKPVLDTKTGKVYRTMSEAGKQVAAEYGLAIHNWVWYSIPDRESRFKLLSNEEYLNRMKAEQPKAEQLKVEVKTQPTQNPQHQPAGKKS